MSPINIVSIVISLSAIAVSAYTVVTTRRTIRSAQGRIARANTARSNVDSLLNVEARVARFDRFHDRSVMHIYDNETGAVLDCVEPERCEAHSVNYARPDQDVLPASTGAGNTGLEERS